MKADMTSLTETQRQTLDAGKSLAEELGLTLLPHQWPAEDIEFTEGQTVLVVTPFGMNIGTIRVTHGEINRRRYSHYFLNGVCLLEKSQRFRSDEWVPVFGPEFDLRLPVQSVLYVS